MEMIMVGVKSLCVMAMGGAAGGMSAAGAAARPVVGAGVSRAAMGGAAVVMSAAGTARGQFVAQVVSGTPAGDALDRPVGVTYAPGDYKRIFVWQKTGKIRIIDISQPTPVTQASATPFLDVTSL